MMTDKLRQLLRKCNGMDIAEVAEQLLVAIDQIEQLEIKVNELAAELDIPGLDEDTLPVYDDWDPSDELDPWDEDEVDRVGENDPDWSDYDSIKGNDPELVSWISGFEVHNGR